MNKVDTGRSTGGTRGLRVALLVVVALIAWPEPGRAQLRRTQAGGPTTKAPAKPVGPAAPPRPTTTAGSAATASTSSRLAAARRAATGTRSTKTVKKTKKTTKKTATKNTKKTSPTTAKRGELGLELSAGDRRIGVGLASSLQVKILGTGGAVAVNLTLAGAPPGVTTSFDSNPIRRYTDLRIGVGPTAAPGSYPLTVNGTDGEQIATSTFTLVVSTGPGGDEDGSAPGTGGTDVPTPGLPVSPGSASTTAPGGPTTTGLVRVLPTTVPGTPTATVAPAPGATTIVPTTVAGATTVPGATTAPTTTTVPATTVAGVFALEALPTTASVIAGGTAPFTIAISGVQPSTVNYVPTGLPTGTNATFALTATGATATIATSATTPIGTYPLAITASSGNQIKVLTLTLFVAADFAIVPAAPTVRLTAGNSASLTIGVVAGPNFANPVRLAVNGQPASVTASISPNPITPSAASAATLSLSTSSSTAPGSYVLQVSGTGGTWDKAVPVVLIVDSATAATTTTTTTTVAGSADPTITITPSAVTVRAGLSVSAQVVTGPPAGSTGQITLAVSGAPAGIAVAITPNPSSGVATILVSVTAGTPANTYALVINAIAANGRTKQATLTVVVTG